MGSITCTNFVKTVMGNKRISICDGAFTSTYATGGDALSASTLKMAEVEFLMAHPTLGYAFQYDYTNGLLLAYQAPSGTAAAALSEVPDGTSLTGVTGVKIIAIGYGVA